MLVKVNALCEWQKCSRLATHCAARASGAVIVDPQGWLLRSLPTLVFLPVSFHPLQHVTIYVFKIP